MVKGRAGGKDITFTATWTKTFDNVLTCGANADNKVVHVPVTGTGTGTDILKAAQTLSSNGKQVSGWTLTAGVNATGSNDLDKLMRATFTACLPDKPYTEMTPEELRRLPTVPVA